MQPSIHIAGICGTLMSGIALLAREKGWRVSGCDRNSWPPISTMLSEQGIAVINNYDASQLQQLPSLPDVVVFGNALGRGNPLVEEILERDIRYTSGAEWLGEHVLRGRRVIVVAGTHGKTTTTAMLAWILENAGYAPGFLIAGRPGNFTQSARLGKGDWFVIEGDEYDTAFFDKRSKFVHYRPHIAALLNLEYDHADIFSSIADIERQFHHLVRTMSRSATIVVNRASVSLARVLSVGCWSQVQRFALHDEANIGTNINSKAGTADWLATMEAADGSVFTVGRADGMRYRVNWELAGKHNVENALAAIATAAIAGIAPQVATAALRTFKAPRRRLEYLGCYGGVHLYDDLAHHPTAIRATLAALGARICARDAHLSQSDARAAEPKNKCKEKSSPRLIAVLEKRSNTMCLGVHDEALPAALAISARAFVLCTNAQRQQTQVAFDSAMHDNRMQCKVTVQTHVDVLLVALSEELRAGDYVVFLSNGDFHGLQQKLIATLQHSATST